MARSLSVLMKLYSCYKVESYRPHLLIFLNLEIIIISKNMRSFFSDLESNDKEKVEEFKFKLREQFNETKDSWILNGMYEYYMATNSTRALDVLVTLREPHDKYLFDRLYEGIKSKDKMPSLLLFGNVVRRQPIWLYKISQHSLLKELLRLLKIETDTVIIVISLLVLNILLPLIPALIGPYLQDVFEIFSRFAAWNTNNPNKLPDGHLLHLQIALYTLFHRLYGMFPYNFLSYLRQEYSLVDHMPIFNHTIKPMLSTVRLNPTLVTITSKEFEISNSRWKKLEHHDIIVQCAQLLTSGSINIPSNNVADANQPDIHLDKLLSALKTNNSGPAENSCARLETFSEPNKLWSPTVHFGNERTISAPTSIPYIRNTQNKPSAPYIYEHSISPPETGIEATPETTPIRMECPGVTPPQTSSAKRILINVMGFGNKTPSSPVSHGSQQQDTSAFKFPPNPDNSTHTNRKIEAMVRERNQILASDENKRNEIYDLETVNHSPTMISLTSKRSSVNVPHVSNPENQRMEDVSVEKEGLIFVEDGTTRSYETVLQKFSPAIVSTESSECYECCEQEQVNSPCSSGGLHMPDARSMLVFTKQVHRLRYYSQCNSDTTSTQTLCDSNDNGTPNGETKYTEGKVRRANSCPHINRVSDDDKMDYLKLSKIVKTAQTNDASTFGEQFKSKHDLSKFQNKKQSKSHEKDETIAESSSVCTQTEELPASQYPYEHLFLSLFPQLGPPDSAYNVNKNSTSHDNEAVKFWCNMYSPSSLLHRYMDTILRCDSKEVIAKTKLPFKRNILHSVDSRYFKEQVLLLSIQLHFEEYRREVHAERNRRLLGRSRNVKALEEHNSALRDQIIFLQKDLENSAADLSHCRAEFKAEKDRLNDIISCWQNHSMGFQSTIKQLKSRCQILEQELREEQMKSASTTKALYEAQATLLNMGNELKCTRQEAASCRKYKAQVHILQREVLKAGEMIIQYRNTVRELGRLNCSDVEIDMYKKVYTKQVHQLQINLHAKIVEINALKSYCSALKAEVQKKKQHLEEQKLTIDKLNEKYKMDVKTWMEKYDAMKASYNREVECSHDLQHKLAIARAVHKRYSYQHINKLSDDGRVISHVPVSAQLSADNGCDSNRRFSSHESYSQQQQSLTSVTSTSLVTRRGSSSSVTDSSGGPNAMSVDEIKIWLETGSNTLPLKQNDVIDLNIVRRPPHPPDTDSSNDGASR